VGVATNSNILLLPILVHVLEVFEGIVLLKGEGVLDDLVPGPVRGTRRKEVVRCHG
jgi:hypothetical protein